MSNLRDIFREPCVIKRRQPRFLRRCFSTMTCCFSNSRKSETGSDDEYVELSDYSSFFSRYSIDEVYSSCESIDTVEEPLDVKPPLGKQLWLNGRLLADKWKKCYWVPLIDAFYTQGDQDAFLINLMNSFIENERHHITELDDFDKGIPLMYILEYLFGVELGAASFAAKWRDTPEYRGYRRIERQGFFIIVHYLIHFRIFPELHNNVILSVFLRRYDLARELATSFARYYLDMRRMRREYYRAIEIYPEFPPRLESDTEPIPEHPRDTTPVLDRIMSHVTEADVRRDLEDKKYFQDRSVVEEERFQTRPLRRPVYIVRRRNKLYQERKEPLAPEADACGKSTAWDNLPLRDFKESDSEFSSNESQDGEACDRRNVLGVRLPHRLFDLSDHDDGENCDWGCEPGCEICDRVLELSDDDALDTSIYFEDDDRGSSPECEGELSDRVSDKDAVEMSSRFDDDDRESVPEGELLDRVSDDDAVETSSRFDEDDRGSESGFSLSDRELELPDNSVDALVTTTCFVDADWVDGFPDRGNEPPVTNDDGDGGLSVSGEDDQRIVHRVVPDRNMKPSEGIGDALNVTLDVPLHENDQESVPGGDLPHQNIETSDESGLRLLFEANDQGSVSRNEELPDQDSESSDGSKDDPERVSKEESPDQDSHGGEDDLERVSREESLDQDLDLSADSSQSYLEEFLATLPPYPLPYCNMDLSEDDDNSFRFFVDGTYRRHEYELYSLEEVLSDLSDDYGDAMRALLDENDPGNVPEGQGEIPVGELHHREMEPSGVDENV